MATPKPLITIITPTYNAGRFVGTCIESVASQKFTNYEHLIIDGLSSDDTVSVVKKYQQNDPNIKLIVERDKGVYDAMNKGVNLSTSGWLYFLGADDTLYNNSVLEEIAAKILISNAEIIYGDVYFRKLNRLYDKEFNVEKILTRNICHQAIFYHNSVFKTLGEYNLQYSVEADYDFNLRCWFNAQIQRLYVPVTIAYYEDGGLSSAKIDASFRKDFPAKIISLILNRNCNVYIKINFLSKAYRKIFQRYSFKIFIKSIFNNKFSPIEFSSICWLLLTSPFFFLKKIIK